MNKYRNKVFFERNRHKIKIILIILLLISLRFSQIITNINSIILGGVGDVSSGLLWLTYLFKNISLFAVFDNHNITNYPFGEKVFDFRVISQLPLFITVNVLSQFFSGIATINLTIMLGLFTSSLILVHLLNKLKIQFLVKIMTLIGFIGSPFIFEKISGHLAYVFLFGPILFILAVYKFFNTFGARKKRFRLIIISVFLSCISDPYLAVAVIISFYIFLIFCLIYLKELRKYIFYYTIYTTFFLFTIIGIFNNYVFNQRRDLNGFLIYSSRIEYFFIPPYFSPFIPQFMKNFQTRVIAENGTNFSEASLYLGVIYITSAILIIFSKKLRTILIKNDTFNRYLLINSLFLIIFSLPPYFEVIGYRIYLPSYLIFNLFPYLRSINRIAFVAFIFLLILVALFFNKIVKKKKMAIFLIILMLIDFNFFPTYRENIFPNKKERNFYYHLSSIQDVEVIAHLPIEKISQDFNGQIFSWQYLHDKKLINTRATSSYLNDFLSRNLIDNSFLSVLKILGADAIVIPAIKLTEIQKTDLREDSILFNDEDNYLISLKNFYNDKDSILYIDFYNSYSSEKNGNIDFTWFKSGVSKLCFNSFPLTSKNLTIQLIIKSYKEEQDIVISSAQNYKKDQYTMRIFPHQSTIYKLNVRQNSCINMESSQDFRPIDIGESDDTRNLSYSISIRPMLDKNFIFLNTLN